MSKGPRPASASEPRSRRTLEAGPARSEGGSTSWPERRGRPSPGPPPPKTTSSPNRLLGSQRLLVLLLKVEKKFSGIKIYHDQSGLFSSRFGAKIQTAKMAQREICCILCLTYVILWHFGTSSRYEFFGLGKLCNLECYIYPRLVNFRSPDKRLLAAFKHFQFSILWVS